MKEIAPFAGWLTSLFLMFRIHTITHYAHNNYEIYFVQALNYGLKYFTVLYLCIQVLLFCVNHFKLCKLMFSSWANKWRLYGNGCCQLRTLMCASISMPVKCVAKFNSKDFLFDKNFVILYQPKYLWSADINVMSLGFVFVFPYFTNVSLFFMPFYQIA